MLFVINSKCDLFRRVKENPKVENNLFNTFLNGTLFLNGSPPKLKNNS